MMKADNDNLMEGSVSDFMVAAKKLWEEGLTNEFKNTLGEFPPTQSVVKSKTRGRKEAEKDADIVSTVLELN
ncbi:MAG: hypothetical protein COB76_04040 [Alphaproteobacteria bacterium]|nr:MAG: hypothetical protein COB76_04040 [Alphaproteobacteria bacterium]